MDIDVKSFEGARVTVSTPIAFDDLQARLMGLMGHLPIEQLSALAKTPITRDEFVEEVTRKFVGVSGFMVFAQIDHGGWLEKFDIRRRTVRWIFGNPLIAVTMIRHDISAGLFAPVEMLITEEPDKGGTTITFVRPSTLMVIEENPPLRAAAEALDAKVDALLASATRQEATSSSSS